MFRLVTISDTHGKHWWLTHNGRLPEGDIIIHSGDSTPRGSEADIEEFLRWYGDLDYGKIILIAGNHDWGFERSPEYFAEMCESYGVTYLNDSGCKYKGINIWGSPVSPEFGSWAFNKNQAEIKNHWDLIPNNTDILVTHGPPLGFGDMVTAGYSPNRFQNVGCRELLDAIENRIKPVIHICGHIHEGRGVIVDKRPGAPITYVNTSTLDERYQPHNEDAFVFDWDRLLIGDSRGHDHESG